MQEKARAKINLFLHITGKRADGYHTLESMVAFADDLVDIITIEKSQIISLSITGALKDAFPEGTAKDNIAYKAAIHMQKMYDVKQGVAITLEKNIPIGAGLGGGSSDAATVMKMLRKHWHLSIDDKELVKEGLKLGADVPVCMVQHAAWMEGIGEEVLPLKEMVLPAVLISTGIPLATKDVFQGLTIPARHIKAILPLDNQSLWLSKQSNDLTKSAMERQPAIKDILESIEKSGAWLTRLSGSGATCFGLYKESAHAEKAAKILQNRYPRYQIHTTTLR